LSQKWEQQSEQDSSTDGGSGWRQNWMEKSSLWPMLHC